MLFFKKWTDLTQGNNDYTNNSPHAKLKDDFSLTGTW